MTPRTPRNKPPSQRSRMRKTGKAKGPPPKEGGTQAWRLAVGDGSSKPHPRHLCYPKSGKEKDARVILRNRLVIAEPAVERYPPGDKDGTVGPTEWEQRYG